MKDQALISGERLYPLQLTPERRLLITIFALTMQDLHIQRHFKNLKEFFVIKQTHKIDVEEFNYTLEYIALEHEYVFCFSHICWVLNLDRGGVIKFIKEKLMENTKTKKLLLRYEKEHGEIR